MPPPSSHPQHPQLLPPPLPRTRTEPDLLRDVSNRPPGKLCGLHWMVLSQSRNLQPGSLSSPRAPSTLALGRNNIHMVISPGTTRARDRRRGPGKLLEAVPNGPSKLAVPKKRTQGWGTVTEGWGCCRWRGARGEHELHSACGWMVLIYFLVYSVVVVMMRVTKQSRNAPHKRWPHGHQAPLHTLHLP